jgi:hydroxyacylglutathione hydrolase
MQNPPKLQFYSRVILFILGKKIISSNDRSCGSVISKDYAALYRSINKLKNLPNETLLFPGHDNALQNLSWVNSLDPKNQFLKMRMKAFEQAVKNKQFCVPSLMLEEKRYNPFLRCTEKYFCDLMEETDPVKVFTKMKKTQEIMFSSK